MTKTSLHTRGCRARLPGVSKAFLLASLYPGGNSGLAITYPGGNFSQEVILGCYT